MERRHDIVDRYLDRFAEPGLGRHTLDGLVTDDVVFVEHPNAVNPAGSQRDLAGMHAGLAAGNDLLRRQRFTERRHLVADSSVVTRARWEGELAVEVGAWPAGTVLHADVAMFFDLDATGRIRRQENYDCYLPGE